MFQIPVSRGSNSNTIWSSSLKRSVNGITDMVSTQKHLWTAVIHLPGSCAEQWAQGFDSS